MNRLWKADARVPSTPGRGMTSFLFAELDRMTNDVDEDSASACLRTFLGARTEAAGRRNVIEDQAAIRRIMSIDNIPAARWPSAPFMTLSLGQQVGVAEALSPSSVTAVNGPLGTGKTTLLRDIIANRVAERADRLADVIDIDGIFTDLRLEETVIPIARPELVARTGIVVASNSNAAVENVSR